MAPARMLPIPSDLESHEQTAFRGGGSRDSGGWGDPSKPVASGRLL